MEYTHEFKEFLEIAKKCNQTYVGHGNPNASILIVANEPGTVDESLITNDLLKNLEKWESNLSGIGIDEVKNMFDDSDELVWTRFNPLWPYKGQKFSQIKVKKDEEGIVRIVNAVKRPTSRSWLQYQKLIDMINSPKNESKRRKEDQLDFFRHAFVTDFCAIYGKSSNDISRDARLKSIKERLPLFSSAFISHFSIIIVASGHYIRDFEPLNDLRNVFQGFDKVELINDSLGWRNIHYSVDRKRILIHAKHFASTISDKYLQAIAAECVKENRLNLR